MALDAPLDCFAVAKIGYIAVASLALAAMIVR
jgi:hypothetical protein